MDVKHVLRSFSSSLFFFSFLFLTREGSFHMGVICILIECDVQCYGLNYYRVSFMLAKDVCVVVAIQ